MSSVIRHMDLQLARRVELAEAEAARACAEGMRRMDPDAPAAWGEFAGGIAVFTGKDSPITQAVGVGLDGPVAEADIDALERFFRDRGATVALEVCPLAGLEFYGLLAKRGYRLVEVSNVLVRSLGGEVFSAPPPHVTMRIAEQSEAAFWTRTVAEGFAEQFPVTPPLLEVMEGFFRRPGATCFLAYVDGEVAGGGVVSRHKGVAGLFGASTLPAFRRRGVQSALLAARLSWAQEHGCNLAASIALPGSASQRNIERAGFQVAYTRTKMLLE